VQWHLDRFVRRPADARVFGGPKGGLLRGSNFRRLWIKALHDAGVPTVHFHDLRHTGNTVAASTVASTRELMIRMGHSSTRATLIYQHATDERDRQIADGSTC
jgi:integrase